MEKTCKQCGRNLPEDNYRKYAPRGKGIYKTEQGRHTICKECESINSRALALEKLVDKTDEEQKILDKIIIYYTALESKGIGIASAVAGRLLGKTKPVAVATQPSILDKLDNEISRLESDTAAKFMECVRLRAYPNSAAAWARYDELKQPLLDAGLREEAARLIDIWEQEEEEVIL